MPKKEHKFVLSTKILQEQYLIKNFLLILNFEL